jgi:hypothetical protein
VRSSNSNQVIAQLPRAAEQVLDRAVNMLDHEAVTRAVPGSDRVSAKIVSGFQRDWRRSVLLVGGAVFAAVLEPVGK